MSGVDRAESVGDNFVSTRWCQLASLAVLLMALGCTIRPPQRTLDEYRQAVLAADMPQVAALHTNRQPALADPDRLVELRRAHPALWRAATERLRGTVRDVRITAEVQLTTGATVTLVHQGDRWRVDGGTLWVPGADTPEAALQTLFDAVASSDLSAVRSVLPEAQQSTFATDAALRRHLERIRGRVSAALARIGRIRPGIAVVRGDRATIAYQGQRQVRFVNEGKRWRVLDVE